MSDREAVDTDGGLAERLAREAIAEIPDGPHTGDEWEVIAGAIHKALPEVTRAYEVAMEAEGVKHYRRALVHRAAIEALK